MKKQTLFFISFITLFAIANPPQKTSTTQKPVAKVAPSPNVADDAIKFEKSNAEEAIEINDKDILITGDENKLTITGNVGKIVVTGKNNDITLVIVNEITVSGNGNFISWEKTNVIGKNPMVLDKGGYNNIGKRLGNTPKSENE